MLTKQEIDETMAVHRQNPGARAAQIRLALEVTKLVHGEDQLVIAHEVTDYLKGADIGHAEDAALEALRQEIPSTLSSAEGSIIDALVATYLAKSNTEARRFLQDNAVSVNGQKISRENFEAEDFRNGRLLIRRGKAFKDSALVELET